MMLTMLTTMLTTLVLAFLAHLPLPIALPIAQEKAAKEAPLASERRELAEIQLLLGAERKYAEAKEHLARLREQLAARTEPEATELLAEVARIDQDVRRALGEAVPALAEVGQDKLDAAVSEAILRGDFAFVRALGKRAVPGLMDAVRANPELLTSTKDEDPLSVLVGIDPLAVSRLAGELLEEPSFFWKKRILRVLDADLAERDELWEAGQPPRFLGEGLLETAEKHVGDPDVGAAAFQFLAGMARRGVRSEHLAAALLGELRSREYARRFAAILRIETLPLSPAPFVALLDEADDELRDLGARVLVERFGHPEHFESSRSILRRAEDESPGVRRRVADWLSRHEPRWGSEERGILVALLWDPDADVRGRAWEVLEKMETVERSVLVPAAESLVRGELRDTHRVFASPLADEVYRSLLKSDAPERARLAWVATNLPSPLAYELLGVLAADSEASVVSSLVKVLQQRSAGDDPAAALRVAGVLLDNPVAGDHSGVVSFVRSLVGTRTGLDALARWAIARTDEPPLLAFVYQTQLDRRLWELDPALACACLRRLFVYRAAAVLQALRDEKLVWSEGLARELVKLAADPAQPIQLRVVALEQALRKGEATEEHRAIACAFLKDPLWRDWKSAENAWDSLEDLLEKRPRGLANPTILAAVRDESVPSELTGRLAAKLREHEEGAAEIVQTVIRHRSDEEAWADAVYQVVWAMGRVPRLQDPEFLTQAVRDDKLAAAAFQVLGLLADARYLPLLTETVERPADQLELERAAGALSGYLDDRAVEPLLAAAAKAQKPEVRDAALAHLEKIREYVDARERWATRKAKAQTRDEVVAALVAQLADKSDDVKVQAIRALATWEAVETMPRLIELTRSGSKSVAAAARAALERLNAPKGE